MGILWTTTWVVLKKEIKDALRDKRSLRMAFLPPLYFMAIFVGGVLFALHLANDKKVEGITQVKVPVKNAQQMPDFSQWLSERGVIITPIEGDPETLIKQKIIDFALVLPEDAQSLRSQGKTLPIWLIYDAADAKNASSLGFVRNLFYAWNANQGALQLMAQGIAPDLSTPGWLREKNMASEQKMSIFILGSLPLTLLLAAFIGSVGFAADMTAGERERRSLEPLLITPAPRLAFYFGKWGTAFLLTLSVLAVQMLLLALALAFLPFNQLGLKVALTAADYFKIYMAIIPVTVMAISLQIGIAILAKSFKDAQTLVGLLVFIPMMPLTYTLFNPGEFEPWWLWVPVLGQAAVIKNIILGQAIPAYAFSIFWLVSAGFTTLAMALGAKQFNRSKIIYGH